MLNPLFCWRSSIARNSSLLTGFIKNRFAGKDRKKPFTLKWVFYRGLTHNLSADNINNTELEKITTKTHLFKAVVKGDFPENAFPVEQQLELKEGAKVMFLRNDNETPRRFFNGKIGTVTSIRDKEVSVHCQDDADEITVSPVTWENIRYTTNPENQTVEEEIIGTSARTQDV